MNDERKSEKVAERELVRIARKLATEARQLRTTLPDNAEADTHAQLATLLPVLREGFSNSATRVHAVGQLLERFLHEYDTSLRRRRGIYFTPEPIIRYLVSSAHQLVESRFRDVPRIRFIDPACGCGAFFAECQRRFVEQSLPDRQVSLLGFEIVRTTGVIADLLLRESELSANLPLQIEYASPLDDGEQWRDAILGTPAEPDLPVILGNPPYANFGKQNQTPWIRTLLADYRRGLSERKLNLADDFIKFLRWGQYWIDRAGGGILAMITSHTYLRGLTQRRMRESLLETFDEVFIYDLHGSHGKRRDAKDGARDENVFPILSGVAIGIFVKHAGTLGAIPPERQVKFYEHTGTRIAKLEQVQNSDIATTQWQSIRPVSPAFNFVPAIETARVVAGRDYASLWPLDRIFRECISGVQTKNDATFVGFTPEEVAKSVQRFLRETHAEISFDERLIGPYLVAPFDRRWIYYDPRLLGRARASVMRHMLRPNVGLVFMRQSTSAGEYDHFLTVDCLVSDRVFYSRHGAPFLAPLWLWEESQGSAPNREANLRADFLQSIAAAIGEEAPQPRDVLAYLYAVFHSPRYRAKYASELRSGFPRAPLPQGKQSFRQLAEIGEQLIRLHLLPGQMNAETSATGEHASAPDFDFTIGGYRVLHRWRKQRRGRKFSLEYLCYEVAVKNALRQTAELMRALDELSH